MGWKVSSELGSDGSFAAVEGNDLTPASSESSIVDSVFGLVDVTSSLSKVPLCSGAVTNVLDVNQNLIRSLSGLSSSEASEHSFLVESDWLAFVIALLLGRLDFLWHVLSICNNDYLNTQL